MRRVLLISPHYDDAVLSAGQFMAGRPDADVVTIFGGMPENSAIQTTYDSKCGFANAEDAVNARVRENDEALALLNAQPINFDYTDSQYGIENKLSDIIDDLEGIIEQEDYEFILAPLGLAHPDHELVTEALLKVDTDIPIYLWEDLPLRVVAPEEVPKRLKAIKKKTELTNIGSGPVATKIRALSCYRSQIGTGILDPYLMYVPERFHRVL